MHPIRIALASLLLSLHPVHAADAPNLLLGDTGLVVGGAGLLAQSSPWSHGGDQAALWTGRGLPTMPGLVAVESGEAAAGRTCLALAKPADAGDEWTALLQVRTAPLPAGTCRFSLDARADAPCTLLLSLCACGPGRANRARVASGRIAVGRDWQRGSASLVVPTAGAYVATVELLDAGRRVQLDDLALRAGDEAGYLPPLPLALALEPARPGPLPLLAIADGSPDLACTLRWHGEAGAAVEAVIEEVDGGTRTITLEPLAAGGGERPVALPLGEVGIWRVRVLARDPGGRLLGDSGAVQLGRIRPRQGRADPFFGLHPHWNPLIPHLGAGAVRDMRLLTWSRIQPDPASWIDPPADLLAAMRGSGQRFLFTLVGEHPGNHHQPWEQATWGTVDYGDIPLWAASGRVVKGLSGDAMMPRPEALADYARRAAAAVRGLDGDLEVINEPLHYMPAEDYVPLLRTVYQAVKAVDPARRVVGGASPPSWSTLASRPYGWYEEAFAAGALACCDAWSIHPYDAGEVPEHGYDGAGEDGWVRGLLALMDRHGGRKPLIISEKGRRSPTWGVHPAVRAAGRTAAHEAPDARADGAQLVRAHVLQRLAGVESFYWFNYPTSLRMQSRYWPWDGGFYTLTDADLSPRPALVAYAAMTERLAWARPVGRLELPQALRGAAFVRAGAPLLVLWRWSRDECRPGVRPEPVRLAPPSGTGPLLVHDTWGRRVADDGGGLTLGSDPIYVEPAPGVGDPAAWIAAWHRLPAQGLPTAETVGVRLAEAEDGHRVVAGIQRLAPQAGPVAMRCAGGAAVADLAGAATAALTLPVRLEPGGGELAVELDLQQGHPARTHRLRYLGVPARPGGPALVIGRADQVVVNTDEFRPWTGAADASLRLSAWWEPAALHLAGAVRDDRVWANPQDRAAWNGDAVEILIDPDPLAALLRHGLGADARHLVIPARPGLDTPLRQAKGLQRRLAVEATADGYRFRLDIPAQALGLERLHAGQVLAGEVLLDDADTPQGRKVQLAWSGRSDAHRDGAGWGALVLEAP
ncbi:MAG: hypothetical protein L6R48_06540 [Planctomycetes bacterium]|nr:hypothetical protein [Planctomycetota bacterium]